MSYNTRLVADLRQLMTLRQHYYPEGGWGWFVLAIGFLVQTISHGLHMAIGVLTTAIIHEFQQNLLYAGVSLMGVFVRREKKWKQFFFAGMVGSLSISVGLVLSPVTIALCRKKSTRLLAVIGGLVTTLGCLFSSFALQFHQMFFSYGELSELSKQKMTKNTHFAIFFSNFFVRKGIIVGIGVGMTRDCSTIMIAQYFKKKREFVEIFTVAGSGFGILFMSNYFKKSIEWFGWRWVRNADYITRQLSFAIDFNSLNPSLIPTAMECNA